MVVVECVCVWGGYLPDLNCLNKGRKKGEVERGIIVANERMGRGWRGGVECACVVVVVVGGVSGGVI